MKCTHSYANGSKQCPHPAIEGRDVCIYHESENGKDFHGKDLSGLDLEEAYLAGAVLSESDLSGATLTRAVCDGATFEGANLTGAVARESSFDKAILRDAVCNGIQLKYASAEGAICANCMLMDADLTGAILRYALMPGAQLQGASLLDADLKNSILLEASLENAILRGAELSDSDLQMTDLRGADLRNSVMSNCNVRGADMRGADLKYVNMEGAILSNANLQNADFAKSILKGATLQSAKAKRSNFRDTSLEDSILVDANFEKSNFRGANLSRADVDGTVFTDTELYNAKIEGAVNLRYSTLNSMMMSEKRGDAHRAKKEYVATLKRYDEAISTYIDLKNYFNTEGLYDKSGEYYIREWAAKGKIQYTTAYLSAPQLKTNKYIPYYLPFSFRHRESNAFKALVHMESKTKWAANKMLFHFARYGESPQRVLFTSLMIILMYAVVYWASGGITPDVSSYTPSFLESVYFSAVTFTTLGYGDFHPKSSFQIFAISEALLGAFIMAFFVVVVSRRLIR